MKRTTTYSFIALTLAATITVARFSTTSAITESAMQTKQTQETQQTRLSTIITKGDQEITRRLSALNKLSATITSTTKLSSADKQLLTSEVSSATTGLTQLKLKLDAETTLDAAREDAKSIATQYRVYALITPKVHLMKVADGQIVVETKLTELAAKLQQRLSDLKTAGKDTSALESTLTNVLLKIAAAQSISSSVQTKVISLQPSDYNNDHTILAGLSAQLKTAHHDLVEVRNTVRSLANDVKQLADK